MIRRRNSNQVKRKVEALNSHGFFSNDDDEVSRGGQEGGAGEVKQLALFVDKHQSPSPSKNGAEEKSKELSQGSSRDQELDLELRLGLDHHER